MQTLIADIETDDLLDSMTKVYCLCILDADSGVVDSYTSTSLEEGISRLNDADRVVMHNGIGFDHPALAKFGYNFPIDKIYDTLVASRLVDPTLEGGHSLRAWGERLGFPKGEYEDWSKLSDAVSYTHLTLPTKA